MITHYNTRPSRIDNKLKGFTLIELVVTITIVSILVAIAVPSIQELLRKNRIDAEAQRVFVSLTRARNNALTTNSPSFVCRSTDGQVNINSNISCRTGGMDQLDWAHDLLVYTVLPGQTLAAPNNRFFNQRIQRVDGGNNNAARVQMLQNISEAPRDSLVSTSNTNDLVLRFNSDGSVENSTPFRIGICDDGTDGDRYGKLIEINASGQIRLYSVDDDNPSRNCTPDENI